MMATAGYTNQTNRNELIIHTGPFGVDMEIAIFLFWMLILGTFYVVAYITKVQLKEKKQKSDEDLVSAYKLVQFRNNQFVTTARRYDDDDDEVKIHNA